VIDLEGHSRSSEMALFDLYHFLLVVYSNSVSSSSTVSRYYHIYSVRYCLRPRSLPVSTPQLKLWSTYAFWFVRRCILANMCCIFRSMRFRKLSRSWNSLQSHSRSLILAPFDRSHSLQFSVYCNYTVSPKMVPLLLPIVLPNAGQFSIFFHPQT